MTKYKSTLLLGLLFGAAWAATSQVKTDIYVFVNTAKIEGPSFLIGQNTQPSMAVLLGLALMLWLLRDQFARVFAATGAIACLVFCVDSAQIISWSARLLNAEGAFAPAFMAMGQQSLWTQFIGASIAFALSALCLWLCARAAGPQQPRPLAKRPRLLTNWRDWLSWNRLRAAQNKGRLDVSPLS